MTTLPVSLGVIAVAGWVGTSGTRQLAPTVGWVVVAVALATRLFRWEPRR